MIGKPTRLSIERTQSTLKLSYTGPKSAPQFDAASSKTRLSLMQALDVPEVHDSCRSCGTFTAAGYPAHAGRIRGDIIHPCLRHVHNSAAEELNCPAAARDPAYRCAKCSAAP